VKFLAYQRNFSFTLLLNGLKKKRFSRLFCNTVEKTDENHEMARNLPAALDTLKHARGMDTVRQWICPANN
jgi:hypothetical protein